MVIFLRHAQTDSNKTNRWMGQLDEPLNSVGYSQAEKVGKELAKFEFDRVVCSPLIRCRQTAEYALRYQKQCDLCIDNDLIERNLGFYEGMLKRPELYDEIETSETVEPFVDLSRRVTRALASILSLPGNSLIVSHSGIYRAFVKADIMCCPNTPRIENGEWVEVIARIQR